MYMYDAVMMWMYFCFSCSMMLLFHDAADGFEQRTSTVCLLIPSRNSTSHITNLTCPESTLVQIVGIQAAYQRNTCTPPSKGDCRLRPVDTNHRLYLHLNETCERRRYCEVNLLALIGLTSNSTPCYEDESAGASRYRNIIEIDYICFIRAGSVTKTTPNRSAEMNLNSTYFEVTSTTSSTTSHHRLRTKDTASTVRTSLITNIVSSGDESSTVSISVGAISGGVSGAFVVLAAVIVLLILTLIRQKRRQTAAQTSLTEYIDMTGGIQASHRDNVNSEQSVNEAGSFKSTSNNRREQKSETYYTNELMADEASQTYMYVNDERATGCRTCDRVDYENVETFEECTADSSHVDQNLPDDHHYETIARRNSQKPAQYGLYVDGTALAS